ncbi:MAG: ribosomal protein S18-alanine N-acetyltransferase [Candidatus Margulisbacteria bacterium]|nr:ribosomal protein S18-alanine N-acetyltransferase [Candidatus Margulisiibacteriota bacterium]MBU1022434.1 ribosomal protein S18-alanine N-acetyltransferase [Candidatus Margulisiibacteriota bacterium]MBU1728418.1 ribosomal protein S18-alanine N-acetyltransferase [Candidatus Margulisiibacteriota bacterium]MBU1768000.1 ribosomal protein S18-alanine N-acetyltransferase [Candidatus Omnitrophota bacterium]MBU1954565.1 ribosomal protein S18-alanine N-acetyltransferase [Candidatus Margulisiibacterio
MSKNELKIEHMSVGDLPQVIALENQIFSNPKPARVFEHDMNIYYAAKFGEKVVGYIGVEHILDEAHIINIAVHPDFRRQGIASALVKNILGSAKSFFLEVRKSNIPAQKMYEKHGFHVIDERKKYYVDNEEDALVMLLVSTK